jgi:serine/threonine protein kinase
MSDASIDLIRSMLNHDLDQRITIDEVLNHQWCKGSNDPTNDDESSALQISNMTINADLWFAEGPCNFVMDSDSYSSRVSNVPTRWNGLSSGIH